MTEMPNSVPVRRTRSEHLVAAERVEAVGRLVEQHQLRVVDEGLGQLDALPHAGGVAADRPVALLVEPDVAQDLGGALAGRRARQPGHRAMWARTRSRSGRAAGSRARACSRRAGRIVDALRRDVEAEDLAPSRGRRQQAEQDPDHRGLAGAVGADQPDDARLERRPSGRRAR